MLLQFLVYLIFILQTTGNIYMPADEECQYKERDFKELLLPRNIDGSISTMTVSNDFRFPFIQKKSSISIKILEQKFGTMILNYCSAPSFILLKCGLINPDYQFSYLQLYCQSLDYNLTIDEGCHLISLEDNLNYSSCIILVQAPPPEYIA